MREKIWNVLQPRLQCERGKNDSPLFALPLLVREPALLKEKFKIKFKYTFNCDHCSYHQEDDHSKLLPSFPEVPADFNMVQPCFVRNCFQCKAPGKRMKMTFSSIPEMLLLHFKEGLPHSRLNELCFTFGGETYTVTAVIQYKNNPDHFVAWIRNGTGDQWMECDDLKSTLCQFVTQEPTIPPKQIHIIMWEKNVQPSSARELEETSACNILQSCLRVLQPDVMPGSSVVLPGKETITQGLKRKVEIGGQNTVKYILSQSPGSKLPGIITLPAGTNPAGLQTMKIVSLPPASSASGLLANVAGLSSATSTGQVIQAGHVIQANTSSFKPVILQSKNKPTILSSMVSSSSPSIHQTIGTLSTTESAPPVTSNMRIVKSGNKLLYIPVDGAATRQIPSTKIIADGSAVQGTKVVSTQKPQISVTGLQSSLLSQGVGKVPNLKYIQLDKSHSSAVVQPSVTTLPLQSVGGKAKTYVVGADGILQEVAKESGISSPVTKHVVNIQGSPSSTPSPAPSMTGTPKIIVKKKNEKGEIVQTVLTDLDCKQNSELMKAIESLKNGDTTTGGAVIQRLLKGKEIGTTQTVMSSTLSPVTQIEPAKLISMKVSSPSVIQSGAASMVQSSPGTNYVRVGDNLIQLQNTTTFPATAVVRGRGRGQVRGGRKKTETRPVPIMSNTVQKTIDLTSVQSGLGSSESQCIVISPPGQSGQAKRTEMTLLGNTASKGNISSPQVVKVLSGSPLSVSGTPVILSPSTAQTLVSSSDHSVMSPTSLLSQQKAGNTVTTTQGKKISTLLASRLAQGGVLKKNVITIDPNQTVKASPVQSPEKSSPIKFILPNSSGQPVSPTKAPSSIIKIQSSPKTGLSPIQTSTLTSPTLVSVSMPSPGTTTGQVISTGFSTLSQSPIHNPEVISASMGSPTSESVVLSDSDGSRSPSKSPKYNPVISVQGPNADTAMIAKAIQTLVDKGVPIQQIQNQAFLSKLIATLKPKGPTLHSVTSPVARSLIQHNPKSVSSVGTSQTVVATGISAVSNSEAVQTVDASQIAANSPSKILTATSGGSPIKVTSVVQTKQTDGITMKEEIPGSSRAETSKGKSAILIKPGQSYLAAVKPFLKLDQSKAVKPKEFDEYKLKSDVLKDKIITEGGFTSIDMIKSKGKEKERVVSNSISVVTPVPVVPPKPDSLVQMEDTIEDLVLPQESSKTKVLSPTRKTKEHSEIVIVESPASGGKSKKANPLHVIADAAISRLPVKESASERVSRIQTPSGRGRGRGRGRPPKQANIPVNHDQETATETDKSEGNGVKGKNGTKRNFMDAFKASDSETSPKDRKVETVDHSTGEGVVASVSKDISDDTKTPESFMKPKGRSRKQPVIATPDSVVDDVPQSTESSSVTPKSRGRGRKSSVEAEEPVNVSKGRGRVPSASPEARGRGRPRKASVETPPTPEHTPVSQTKSVPAESKTTPSSDSTQGVTVTPRGRGRPPKNSPYPAIVKTPTPKEETKMEKLKGNDDLSQAKISAAKERANTSESAVSEVKYVGKYKIQPIERPNTRRGGKPGGSPLTLAEPVETIKTPDQTKSTPARRRGRPPLNPAKRAKTE